MMKTYQRTLLLVVIVVFFLQGCAATQQRRDVVKTGFLSDYSMLTEGKGDHEALLRYINPDADWRSYDKMILDSVTVWKDKETQDVSPEDLQMLTDFAYTHLQEALGQDYTIVTQPGPGVMRAAFAITEAEALTERLPMQGHCNQRLARASRRREHDVSTREQLEDRLFLFRIELELVLGYPGEEGLEHCIRIATAFRRKAVAQGA